MSYTLPVALLHRLCLAACQNRQLSVLLTRERGEASKLKNEFEKLQSELAAARGEPQ